MLFDPELCWNGHSWEVDSVAHQLIRYGDIEPIIIVGIWNTKKRWEEYMPQDVFSYLDEKDHKKDYDNVFSNDYLKFIVEELKPHIDANFRTKSNPSDSYIMGSSMGGLISWYALCKYPDVFHNAVCVSTHWPGVKPEYQHPLPPAIKAYFKDHLPEAGKHNIYFDFGTETLDKYYEPHQNAIDTIMMDKGYTRGEDWLTVKFPGEEHTEVAWRKRVNFPLMYFFKPELITQ